MRRIALVIPEWVDQPDSENLLRQSLPSLEWFAERGVIHRLLPDPDVETPEALAMGLDPHVLDLRQGPLTVAALRVDPPERSTHFHLSLLGYSDGRLILSEAVPEPEEVRAILERSKKLDTKVLTIVAGEARDHALVWEARGDLKTLPPPAAEPLPFRSALPEGDGEYALRRFIDDSINLLSDMELNRMREDQGLPLLNLWWPWGHGVRRRTPNLAIQRGDPALVVSSSMRMEGLSRLVGYRHADRKPLRDGVQLDLSKIASLMATETTVLVYLDVFQRLRTRNNIEEVAWLSRSLDVDLLAPLSEQFRSRDMLLAIVAPSRCGPGIALHLDPQNLNRSSYPFDSRSLDESELAWTTSWEAVRAVLDPS